MILQESSLVFWVALCVAYVDDRACPLHELTAFSRLLDLPGTVSCLRSTHRYLSIDPARLTLDGYHISELNFPQPSLTCTDHYSRSTLPDCLDITSNRYSLITAVLTVGGLLGSLGTAKVIGRYGMYGTIWWTGTINLAGSAIMTVSPHWIGLLFGR